MIILSVGSLRGISQEQALKLTLIIGRLLLKNGAETTRVEDVMERLCAYFDVPNVNVFVTPTFIMLGSSSEIGEALCCRVRHRTINLSVLSEINQFSYGIDSWKLKYDDTMDYFTKKLTQKMPYTKIAVCAAYGFGALWFAMLLGAGAKDALASFLAACATSVTLNNIDKNSVSAFWKNSLAGGIITAIAIFCVKFGFGKSFEAITVASLMPFLPGLAFTNGLRDFIAGDLISGNSRTAEAILFALSLAAGLALILFAAHELALWG